MKKEDLTAKLVEELRAKYGKGSITLASEVPPVPRLSTGAAPLDAILGGGWPRGRIVEVWGPNNAGKSTLMLASAAAAQRVHPKRRDDCVVWCDQENTFDPEWASVLGVDLGRMTYVKPMAGDDLGDLVIQYIRDQVPLIVIDSIIAMVPEKALVKGSGEQSYSPVAALLGQWLPKVVVLQGRSPSVLLVANQVRDNIGFFFGNPQHPPGGETLKHDKSVWLEVRRRGWVTEKGKDLQGKSADVKVGYEMALRILKSKVGGEQKECRLQVRFGKGIILGTPLDVVEEKPEEAL